MLESYIKGSKVYILSLIKHL